MKENEVRKAFDGIEPEPGAQERMYANILKKAAAQKESGAAEQPDKKTDSETVQRSRTMPLWRRWGSLAACLVLVLAIGIVLPRIIHQGGNEEPPVMGGSPFEDVTGPEGFQKLGLPIDAPNGAENRYYCIFDGEIARVDFTLDGHEYTYEAAKLDGNFSQAEGDAVDSAALNAEYGATLDRLPSGTWRAHWNCDGVSYYLTNFDGAEEAAITDIANALMESSKAS